MTDVITAQGLVKIYKSRKSEVRALDGLDLTVQEGTVLGLLGPNGAGKTTTVRILSTLLRPDAGSATVAGFDVVKQAQQLRSVIGLSGQYAAVDENLTGSENLWMFGRLYQLPSAEAKRRAGELLEQFDLVEAKDRTIKTYSGGMRRRLDLASALIGRPRLLFLDEPTTGLDPRSRLGMWDVIRGLVRDGTTLLLTTQYLEEADALADTIAVVDHGRIIARGTADELKAQVGGERIEVVVRHKEDIARAGEVMVRDTQATPTIDEHTRRLTVPSEGGASRLVVIARDLLDANIEIDDIGLRRPTLDDVFLTLTGRPVEEVEAAAAAAKDADKGRGEGSMSTPFTGHPVPAGGIRQAWSDGLVVTWRNLKRIPRIPELAIFAIMQSIMFVLLFAVVFGGAIPLPGYVGQSNAYREYLMPGIFVQTLAFASATTAIGFAEDSKKGIIDRFRSLPMATSAVLSGRTIADVVYNAGILVVLMLSGLLVGWGVNSSIPEFLAGVGLMLLFAFAMSWVGVWLGLSVPSVEVAQQVAFIAIFPITFVSNAFVPIATLPTWLQPFAEWNPVSTLTASARELFGNPNPFATDNLPSQQPILVTLMWIVVIVGVFGTLSVRKYRQTSK